MSSNPFAFIEEEEAASGLNQTESRSDNPFEFIEKQDQANEPRWKQIARSLYQIPAGLAKRFTYPADLLLMIGIGSALDPEELDQIRRISEKEGIPFDEEKYQEALSQAAQMFPTQSNIEGLVERQTGLPLTPKTRAQEKTRLASEAATFAPQGLLPKAAAAIGAPSISTGAEALGLPKEAADMLGLITSTAGATKVPQKGFLETAKKPSGLTTRRFEKLKEPREVKPGKIEQINEKLEADFKQIADKIISEAPIAETRATLKENPAFKSEVAEQFKQVEKLAEQLPEKLHTDMIAPKLVDLSTKKKGTGFAPSEYDKDYRNFIEQFLKDTPSQQITAVDAVKQYRKNNASLSEYYDPQRTKAYNRAKKDALLDYNRAIAEVFEDAYPNTEFSNLFRETNQKWGKIADAEAIESFFDQMFEDGIKYKKGKRFFENENSARPFKRALGEEGFKKFEQLMKDMLSTEEAAKMLKPAKEKGFSDLAKTGMSFLLHPTIGKVKFATDLARDMYKGLFNAFLDKPQLMFTWERAIKELKAGDFQAAERDFEFLKTQAEQHKKESKQIDLISK